ncbi:MAG: hypothetical protein NVS1B4_05290 [Gemmatimonadaceae bacterium]
MTDETFRLTPLDVRRYDFGRALRGYDPTRVEQFRGDVADELERLSRANQELETTAKNALEQLRSFRDRDKALNDALVSAQQLRSEIREQAERESQLILREARAEAERLVDATRAGVRRLEDEISTLDRTRRTYLAHLRTMVERQLAEIDAAQSAPSPAGDGPASGAGGAAPAGGAAGGASHQTPAWLNSLIKE